MHLSQKLSVLHTYRDASEIVKAFARPGGLGFVVIVGPPGVGKTNSFFPLCKDAALFQGGLSPVKLYCELYRVRDKPVVFDDVDELFDTPAGVNLLKCLGQTDPTKRLMWEKASPVLREEGVPNRFVTRSRVMLFANTLKRFGPNLEAVLDRAHAYWFEPSVAEIHQETGKWFRDREIYDYVGRNLASIQTLSMRDYVKASEKKQVGLDWRAGLLESWYKDPKLARVLRLLEQPLSPTQRKSAFQQEGLGAEATYKRYLAEANRLRRELPPAA